MKAIRLSVLLVIGLVAGCSDPVAFFKREGPPTNQRVYDVYASTTLNRSTSSDVLAAFGTPGYGLLSQSKSIIALVGQKKQGYKTWLNMVAFDESEPIARRRYVFISDEKPRQLFVTPWEGVYFDCQMVLPKEVLAEPYANENARRIAILKQVGADTRKDAGEIGKDNKDVDICGMVIGQAIDAVLVKLKESPSLATLLSEPKGLEFVHASYDKGKLRMVITGDEVTVGLRMGSFAKKVWVTFEKPVHVE